MKARWGWRCGLVVVALITALGLHSGERIWLWFAYEVRPVRLTDFSSSRKHVGDRRILILGSPACVEAYSALGCNDDSYCP